MTKKTILHQVAGYPVIRCSFTPLWFHIFANIPGYWASIMETTPGWWISRTGHIASQNDPLALPFGNRIRDRHSRE